MRVRTHILAVLLLTAIPSAVSAQDQGCNAQVTLRVRSAVPGREVRFTGAFLVDDSVGIQVVSSATTPLEVVGTTATSAMGMFTTLKQSGELELQLVLGLSRDSTRLITAVGSGVTAHYASTIDVGGGTGPDQCTMSSGHARGVSGQPRKSRAQ